MDSVFRKLCHFYITDGNEENLHLLKENSEENFDELKEKAKELTTKLQEKTAELGYNADFESFCDLLEEYINKKDNMDDDEKSNYLKLLMTLSEIHEINLREELERYVSYKKKDPTEKERKTIFYKFCRYNISPNNNVDEFNDLKEIAIENNLDFKELQKEAIMYVEEIKILAESLGYDIETDSFESIVQSYLAKKSKLNDYDKTRYLKVLLYLSEIYSINLRELLTTPKEEVHEISNDLGSLLTDLSNPLDNDEVLSILLDQRYHNGYFDIKEITLSNTKESEETPINYNELLASLAYKLYNIFLDKFNNYAFDDLNEKYVNLISEEDLARLETLTKEDILSIIELMSKYESSHYICKKMKLTENLYLFIEQSINETIDLRKEHIGIGENSLFNNDNKPYTIRIYLNAPESKLFSVLVDYIKKCVENNVNYDMKALGDNKDNQEGAILFANIHDIIEKLNILDSIFNENPQLKNDFQIPIYSSGRLNNSIYGISHSGIRDENDKCIKSYNDYFNIVCEVAYYRTISKIILEIITDSKAKSIIENFISLRDVSFAKAEMPSPELAEYNNINFETIKDLVNQYIPLISSTLNIYMTDETKKSSLIHEFQKSLLYISNICQNRPKKEKANIAISSYIEDFIKNN